MSYPLEPSPADMREMGDAAMAFAISFLQGLDEAPAVDLDGVDEVTRPLREEPMPLRGRPFDEVLATIRMASTKAIESAGPGFLGFIPGGGLWSASLADVLADTTNRFVNRSGPAPGFAQIEATAVRWFLDLFGFPAEARGILTSGGSMANFSAIVTARRAMLPEDFLQGTLYVSEQTHASVPKSAALAGFPTGNVRVAPTTPDLRMDLDACRTMIRADREAGLRPFLLIVAAGTTNTGTVDPIAGGLALAREEGLWLHVDGAYGGSFQLTERGRRMFAGIEEADSITLDPHKGMFLPYGTGSLLVRDGAALREAHFIEHGHYLQDVPGEAEIPNFSEYSPELSRDFRGLRVWLPLKLHGADAFREALDEKLDLARYLYEALRDTPGFETPWEPDLTVVPFRYVPTWFAADGAATAATVEAVDAFNRSLLSRINASKRVFMTSTLIDGRFIIRPCIQVHRTHKDRIDEAIEIVRTSAAALEADGDPSFAPPS